MIKKALLGLSVVAASYVSAQTITIPEGWTNLGIINGASVTEITNTNIDYVWRYHNNQWEIYTPDANRMARIENDINGSDSLGYSSFSSPLIAGDALWIHANAPVTFSIGNSLIDATVIGVVKDITNNSLLSDVNVSIYSEDGTLVENGVTDSNGSFDFEHVVGGTYIFSFNADGYNDLNISGIVEEENFNLGQIRMIPMESLQTVDISGEIIDSVTGDNISNARVLLIPGFNNQNREEAIADFQTDDNGRYSYENITSGEYTLIAMKNGYYDYIENVSIYDNGNSSFLYNLSLTPLLNDNEVARIRLEWGENPSDLDSHLVSYNEENESVNWHIYYGDRRDGGEGNLDRDDTNGYGPETITLNSIDTNATYKYYVWKYSGSNDLKDSDAKVNIIYNGQVYRASVPYEDGRAWKVFEIHNGVLQMCETNCMSNTNAGDNYSEISNMRLQNSSDVNILNKIKYDIKSSNK